MLQLVRHVCLELHQSVLLNLETLLALKCGLRDNFFEVVNIFYQDLGSDRLRAFTVTHHLWCKLELFLRVVRLVWGRPSQLCFWVISPRALLLIGVCLREMLLVVILIVGKGILCRAR